MSIVNVILGVYLGIRLQRWNTCPGSWCEFAGKLIPPHSVFFSGSPDGLKIKQATIMYRTLMLDSGWVTALVDTAMVLIVCINSAHSRSIPCVISKRNHISVVSRIHPQHILS